MINGTVVERIHTIIKDMKPGDKFAASDINKMLGLSGKRDTGQVSAFLSVTGVKKGIVKVAERTHLFGEFGAKKNIYEVLDPQISKKFEGLIREPSISSRVATLIKEMKVGTTFTAFDLYPRLGIPNNGSGAVASFLTRVAQAKNFIQFNRYVISGGGRRPRYEYIVIDPDATPITRALRGFGSFPGRTLHRSSTTFLSAPVREDHSLSYQLLEFAARIEELERSKSPSLASFSKKELIEELRNRLTNEGSKQ